MPPKKKFVLSTTVRWTAFEVELLRYLSTISERGMAQDLRAALRQYAKRLPEFDAEAFQAFVKRDALAKMPKGPERDGLRMETDAFLQEADVARPAVVDPLSGRATAGVVHSSAADFDSFD